MAKNTNPRTTKTSTSSGHRDRRLGCWLMILFSVLAWAAVIGGFMSVGGCASVPAAGRWQAILVAGSGYAAVYRDGLPQAPGLYTVNVTEPGKADFYRNGKFVASGTITTTEPLTRRGVVIDVPPGTPVSIKGQ
jgi:hypothetical protein